jgi:DNA-binding transcriptional MerR regulator
MNGAKRKPAEGGPDEIGAIPDKLFFKIREAAKITQVKAHILRYWENEFPQLKPRKSKSGQRIYSRQDIEKLLEIKKLLYVDRFSIEGARRFMAKRFSGRNEDENLRKTLHDIRTSLQEILDVLK